MVFEALVVEVLNRFLGDYVVNLDSSQLQLGIWGGDVVLNNLEVKENAFCELRVPFQVKAGHIGKLELKIPWKNLYTQAVEATLDGVYLLVVPCASIEYDANKEELQLQEVKQRELQRIEEAKQKVADKENPKEEKQDTFIEKLITQVIKNLQVKITNIHIRYEDDITNHNYPLSFGISLQNLSLETTDEQWNPCLHDQCEHVFNKLVRLDYLCAYWNVNTKMYSYTSQTEALGLLKDGVSTSDFIPREYQFIFQPISAKAKLEMNPRAEVDFASPKVNLEVDLQSITIELKRPQYLSIMELLGSIDMMTRNLPYRKYKPNVPCLSNPSAWWTYAINSVLKENIKPRLEGWSWKHIRMHRQKIKNYRQLYKSRITSKKPDEGLISTLEELEKELDLFNITLARQQAEVEAMKAGYKIYRPGAKVEEDDSGGWFAWAWSWAAGKEEKPRDSKSGIDFLMTPEEKSKLYTAIGYSEATVDPTMPKRYEAVKLSVKLLSMSLCIKEEQDKPEIMKFSVINLSTKVTQRPGAQAIKFEAMISRLEVTGLPWEMQRPILLSSGNIKTESEDTLLQIMFETNPLDEKADQRLRVESRPLEIVYNARTVNSLVDFFRPPSDVQLEEITSATLMKLEEFRDKTATGLMYIIETQKVLDLKVNLMASYIIVPQNGSYDKFANLLVLDLGNLKMVSKSRANLPQVTAGESTLEDIMARAYDCFDVQLSSVQLLYAEPEEDWKTARKTKESSQHILQPMDLKLEFCRAMVVSDARMPKFKVYGGLALLSVRISDQKLRGVLGLIDSIPTPESRLPPQQPSLKSRQKLSPDMTPQSVQKRAVHKDLYSSVLSMTDSDDEFYDALSSPMDTPIDLPSSDISLKRSESLRQKQLRKQESMKNMTEFQLEFEITKMLLGIFRHVEGTENLVLELEILGLGTELKLRTYDMTSHTYLKEVSLKCPEQRDSDNKPIYIITTLDNNEDDLLTIEYIKADRNGPEFTTTYSNTEQLIKANISSLDVHLHTEALLNSINFLKSLIPHSENKVSSDEQVPAIEEKKEVFTKKKSSSKKSTYEDMISIHSYAELALLRVFISDQRKRIAEVSIEGLDAVVVLRKASTEITTKLKNIVVLDAEENAPYKKAVSLTGKEVFSFKMTSYMDATEGAAYTDLNVVDNSIKLTVGCIQVIFVKKFVSSLLAFMNTFQTAREAVTEATAQAASGVKDLAERSTRMSLDIQINAPVVVVPQSPISENVVVADFGVIIIQNNFSMIKQKAQNNLPPVIDSMKIWLRELKLYRTMYVDGIFLSEISLLQPVNLEVVVERNLAADWYHEIPDIKILGSLKPLHVVLSQDDLIIILKTLNENLGDNSVDSVAAQSDKRRDHSGNEKGSPSQNSAGRTVVTAAVVEPQKPVKFKTTLKLDFSLDELSLILYGQPLNPMNITKEQRSEQDILAEFKLHRFSTSVKMLSDGSMKAEVKLYNCMLDDKRMAIEKATSRMVEMKLTNKNNAMIDFSYKQGREGMFLDAIIRDIYVCASMEFLLTVVDFFVQANNQVSAVHTNKPTATQTKDRGERVSSQTTSKMELIVRVQNPEIIFVADLTRADAPSLVVTAQCEADINNDLESQKITAAVKDLKVMVCPFLKEKRKKQVTTVLQPCNLFFRSTQAASGPIEMELAVKSLMLKVSPVIINTVITIMSALTPAADSPQEKCNEIPLDLWTKKDVKNLKFWFLEDTNNNGNDGPIKQLDTTGESLKMTVEYVCLTLEAGIGHRTVPMLLAKSTFKGDVQNWSTLINLKCHLNLEVHYYNEVLAVWEPLLEPLEIENSDEFRPWELGIKIKKKAIKARNDAENEEEKLHTPAYKTVLQVSSKDQLNITMSKCGLTMLNNLATAFAEAAGKTSDVFQKDQAPFAIKNSLGIDVTIYPSDSFVVINRTSAKMSYELRDGEILDMDYQRTTNEQELLSNLTNASSKLFYVSLTPQGHTAADKIPLIRLGRRLYTITHEESVVERAIICQIDAVQGSKKITIRSPVQIKNHFSLPFNVFEDMESDLKLLGKIQPNEDFNVPLLSYRSDLRLQLIMKNKEPYAPCETITFGHLNTNTKVVFKRKCCFVGKNEQDPMMINIVAVHDTLTSDNPDEDKNAYVLHLWPTAILQNLLPCMVDVCLTEGSVERTLKVDEGNSAQLHDAVLDKSKLTLAIDYLGHSWTGEYSIKSNQTDIELIKFKTYDDEKSEIDIAILVTSNIGYTLLTLHSPYWMINKTGRMLQYKADDVHHKHPLDYRKPLLFSFGSKCIFQKNKVQLKITDSELSDWFSLDTVGSYGSVKCKGPKKDYQVGVRIDTSSFNLTKIVTFTPFHMIINRTKYRIEVTEECDAKWLSIDSNQCIPFWPARGSEKLVVRVEGCSVQPQKFYFNKQENCLLLRLDNKFGGIIVEVHLAEHSTLVTFKDYHEGAAPFLIINHTGTSTIEYHQSNSTRRKYQLEPGEASYYTWEEPTESKLLKWYCQCEDISGELSMVKDDFLRDNGAFYVESFFEGLQRIILFTDDERTFRLAHESEKAEIADQEIILSLQNLGISLVNNSTKQEVIYIGITSSDVIWESKPKDKSRWKQMSRKQTAQLEKGYKDYMETSPHESYIADLPCDFKALLTPTGTDMKLLQPSEVQIRRNYQPAIKIEYTISTHQRSLRIQVFKIQIQNQLSGAIFPFPFYPITPPKSIAMDSAPKPFADVSIIIRSAGQSEISRFRYFVVLIQEMDLKLDLGFLYALMELFTQSTDTVIAEQKLELFKKDLEYVQTELLTESANDTSPISLYEYFHISPIKLHLSFSISSGSEESNKQQETELVPIQSLNLLLKSIGATLTDVQDVVFKLACLEIQHQFYTTQQLQWEVIRHYSKQAIKQLYVLVLGLDVLGNPFGLIRDISEGVGAFFYEPYQGAIQGPEEFVEGMALGVKALVGGAVGGIAGAASRITGAMAKGVAAITMDEEYQQRRREAMNKQPSGIKEGITRGGKGLVSGFVSGITGIVTKPIKGAQKEGAAGFFKGIGKGLVGAVARPAGGIIDLASSTFQGIKSATESSEEVESLRPPRFIHEDGVIRPYRLREADGMQILQKIENGRFAKFKYFFHKKINDSDLFMITKSGVFFVTQGTFGQMTCEWQYNFEEFTKEPFIVDGRRLRIEAKERVKSVFHAKEYGKIVNFRSENDAKWILEKLQEVRESGTHDQHPRRE
ncbi:intermembrane lipid transfer protein VPS13A isoform X1 [Mobula birostris]|uniref:intermembrane lipid transfer protein VPS13A isoform X1 n=1 Tax=Mobula birostris TaxID=1983395 RepID=UPI003B287C48